MTARDRPEPRVLTLTDLDEIEEAHAPNDTAGCTLCWSMEGPCPVVELIVEVRRLRHDAIVNACAVGHLEAVLSRLGTLHAPSPISHICLQCGRSHCLTSEILDHAHD